MTVEKNRLVILLIGLIVFSGAVNAQTFSNLTLLLKKRIETETGKLSAPLKPAQLNTFIAPALVAPPQGVTAPPDTRPLEELGLWQQAARFARDHKEDFAKLLDMYNRFGELITIPRDATDPKLKVLAYTLLAMQQQSVINQYFTDNRITDQAIKDAIENERTAIKEAIAKLASPTITVFASGNIRDIATNKSTDPTTTGTGTLGATYADSKNVYSVQFTIAATLDTTKSGFGSYLIAPLNGKSLKSALIEWFPKLECSEKSWLHFYGNFASSLWEVQKDSLYKNMTTLGLGALYHYRIFEGLLAETEIGLDGEIGLAGRWLNGDIRNLLKSDVTALKYLQTFPTKKSFFTGIEAGLTFNFGQIIGAAQAYYFFPKKGEPIEGLTGLQISVGLSVRGDIIKGFLSGRN